MTKEQFQCDIWAAMAGHKNPISVVSNVFDELFGDNNLRDTFEIPMVNFFNEILDAFKTGCWQDAVDLSDAMWTMLTASQRQFRKAGLK